jgi:hypothetical protein
MKKSKVALFAFFFSFLSFFSAEVYAGCCDEPSDEWKIKFIPYIWFASVSGDVTAQGVTRSIDADFDEIFDELNMAFMGRAEAWRNRWGITSEIIYMDLEDERNVGGVQLDAGTELVMFELGGGYHVGKWALGDVKEGVWHRHIGVDALAGGRYINMENEIELSAPVSAKVSAEDDWVAPYIGARIKLDVIDRLKFYIWGDIGSFGLGRADITGNLITGLSYEITDRFSGTVGYRWFFIDADHADITIHGPVLGLGIRF